MLAVSTPPLRSLPPPPSNGRNFSAAELGGLPKLDTVSVKELADATNLSAETIRSRLQLWLSDPSHPKAIPFFEALGKPYQIPASWCREKLLTVRSTPQ